MSKTASPAADSRRSQRDQHGSAPQVKHRGVQHIRDLNVSSLAVILDSKKRPQAHEVLLAVADYMDNEAERLQVGLPAFTSKSFSLHDRPGTTELG